MEKNINDKASKIVNNMSDKEVEDTFNNVLNKGTISDEDVKKVMDAVAETDTEEIKEVLDLPSNNGVLENDGNGEIPEGESESEEVKTTIDPNTGIFNSSENNDSEEEKKLDEEMANLLDVSVEDLYSNPETLGDIDFNEDIVKKRLESYGLKDAAQIVDLMEVIKKYRKDPDKDKKNWYNELPEVFKNNIMMQCIQIGNTSTDVRKMFARELLDNLMTDIGFDRVAVDIQKLIAELNVEVENFNKEIKNDVSEYITMSLDLQKTNFEAKIDKMVELATEKYEKEKDEKILESIETVKRVKAAFIESYELKGLLDMLRRHKIKIKKIDIDKYKRHCENFLFKYKKDVPYVIDDISICAPILCRKLPEYDTVEIIRFMIAFMKYTMNFKANDVADHTFMSYFISNIKNMDFVNISKDQEANAFINVFLNNIERGVRLINGYSEYEEEGNASAEEEVAEESEHDVLKSAT